MMTKPKTKKQKIGHETKIEDILVQVSTAHHHLKKLIKERQDLDHIVLSRIGDELRAFEETRQEGLCKSKVFNWATLMKASEAHWMKFFSVKDWTALAIGSSAMFAIISPIISAKFSFNQSDYKFSWYAPTMLQSVRDFHLPESVSHVHFANNFNKPLCPLSRSVTHLHFEWSFNQEINQLSDKVTSIQIDNANFDATIQLPQLITHLTLAHSNMELNLPATLTHLTLPQASNALLSNLPNLKVLDVKRLEDTILKFPPKLEVLRVLGHTEQPMALLPPSLKHLVLKYFTGPLDNLPSSITHLTLGGFNCPVPSLPSSLVHIDFGNQFNQPVNTLPPSLTYIEFGYAFSQPIDHLPHSVTELILGEQFDQAVATYPHSLTTLTVPGFRDVPSISFPPLLKHLSILNSAAYNLFSSPLPPTLTHLYVENLSDDSLGDLPLPPLLTHITCHASFCELDTLKNLPQSIKSIELSGTDVDSHFEIGEWDTDVEFPLLEHCNITAVDTECSMLFRFSGKLKIFRLELLAPDKQSLKVQIGIDFERHAIGVVVWP